MNVERESEGIWLREMPMWVVDTLFGLPDWIESEDPAVKKRLLPPAYEDEEQDREWKEALGSSLEHLVQRRTEIVRNDLQQVRLQSDAIEATGDVEADELHLEQHALFQMFIPAAHVSAWISSLQAGTHAVFILEGLTAEDLERDLEDEGDPDKQLSMVRLSILQDVLVRLVDDE